MRSIIHKLSIVFAILSCLAACTHTDEIKPNVSYTPAPHFYEGLPSAFDPLTPDERKTDWGKELYIATHLGREQDLFRAATGFKRARILLSSEEINPQRQAQIEYGLLLSYWLGNKYDSVIELFEGGKLQVSAAEFPAYDALLIMLYDSYLKVNQPTKAETILALIKKKSDPLAAKITLYTELSSGNIAQLKINKTQEIQNIVTQFTNNRKSPFKAELYNALLPGAGYYYVGQTQSALTSFFLNALFIAATYEFFQHGQTAAGIITGGFELGWYIGGIRGAGLAAESYNNTLYNNLARDTMTKQKLFPILMLDYAF